jgi:hypothetical protein
MEKIEQIKAEIKRKYKSYEKILEKNINPFLSFSLVSRIEECKRFLSFTDTLEVKEVDLKKEIDLVEDKYRGFESLSRADIIAIARYFFELGLKAQKGE